MSKEGQAAVTVEKAEARPSAGTAPPSQYHEMPSANPFLSLQRTIGNQAVVSLLSSGQIQAQLRISKPGDPFEQEADRVADQVMRMPLDESLSPAPPQIHCKCASCAPGAAPCSKCAGDEEDLPIHRQANGADGSEADNFLSGMGPGQPLDSATRSFFEPRFGRDFSDVRTHTDSHAAQSARAINARAFALGDDIVFNSAQFNPGSQSGRQLLAHELVHVSQQGNPRAGSILSRMPDPAHEMAQSGVDYLNSMAEQIASLRQLFAQVLQVTAGFAEASRRAHKVMNQIILQNYLRKARSVYLAQRGTIPPSDPVQGGLRAAFVRVLVQLQHAFDEALGSLRGLAPDIAQQERENYRDSLSLWIEASPFTPANTAGGAAAAGADVRAATQFQQALAPYVDQVVKELPRISLITPAAERLRAGLSSVLQSATAGQSAAPGGAPMPDAAVVQKARDIFTTLQGAHDTVAESIRLLDDASSQVLAYANAPPTIGTSPVANALDTHFQTRDTGYAKLIGERLKLMSDSLKGKGQLRVWMRQEGDRECTSSLSSTTEAHAEPNHVFFCTTFVSGTALPILTFIHELVHAVVPALGTKTPVKQGTATPVDVSYPFERVFRFLTTEEALFNAASYELFIRDFIQKVPGRERPPTDTAKGCPEPEAVQEAIARAAAAFRSAGGWANGLLLSQPPLDSLVVSFIEERFGQQTQQSARGVLIDFDNILGALEYPVTATCPKSGNGCGRGAVGGIGGWSVGQNSVSKSGPTSHEVRLCKDWFSLGNAARIRTMGALFLLHVAANTTRQVRAADAFHYIDLALAVRSAAVPNPPATSLQQHLNADVQAGGAKSP